MANWQYRLLHAEVDDKGPGYFLRSMGGYLWHWGLTVPTAVVGMVKGALWQNRTNGFLYSNIGTKAAPVFVPSVTSMIEVANPVKKTAVGTGKLNTSRSTWYTLTNTASVGVLVAGEVNELDAPLASGMLITITTTAVVALASRILKLTTVGSTFDGTNNQILFDAASETATLVSVVDKNNILQWRIWTIAGATAGVQ